MIHHPSSKLRFVKIGNLEAALSQIIAILHMDRVNSVKELFIKDTKLRSVHISSRKVGAHMEYVANFHTRIIKTLLNFKI